MIGQVGNDLRQQRRNDGRIIAEAMKKVGKDGVITVERSSHHGNAVDVVEGMQFDRGYLSPLHGHRSRAHGSRD